MFCVAQVIPRCDCGNGADYCVNVVIVLDARFNPKSLADAVQASVPLWPSSFRRDAYHAGIYLRFAPDRCV